MASMEKKNEIRAKLSNVKTDMKAEIKKKIRETGMVDGKITAEFFISGLPTKDKGMYEDSYREKEKIFDTWADFTAYAETFFSEDFTDFK